MKLGIALPQLGEWATPENIIKVAQGAEELGYNSLWMLERLLWPINPKSPYPITPDGSLPDQYQYVLDPIVTLAYAAASTKSIRIGTSVLIMPYHMPVMLAKQLATLDVLSGGRFDCGLGLGWSEDEYEVSNTPFKNRGDRGDEFLKCLKVLWTEQEPEFHGKFYHVPKSKVNPKPLQKPHPPITIGGFNPRAFQRAATLGDGYHGGILPFDQMKELLGGFIQAAQNARRDLSELQVVCRGNLKLLDKSPGTSRYPLTGTIVEIKDDLKRCEEMGITEIIFEMNFEPGITTYELFHFMEQLLPG